MRSRHLVPGIVVGLALTLTACGSGESNTPETPTSTSSDAPTPSAGPATVTTTKTVTKAPPTPESSESSTDWTAEETEDDVAPVDSEADQESDAPVAAPSAEPEPEAAAVDDFDAAWAQECADRVVESIEIIDERLLDGGAVSSGLDLLSQSFDCFEDAGVPPDNDPADYTALVRTLSDFSWDAADLYWDDPMTASAKYAVVKENSESLFATINNATGSNYKVP